MNILDTSERHSSNVVRQCAVTGNFQQAVLKALIREVLRILGIHHAQTVNDETIRIHVLSHRTERCCPRAISLTCHRLSSGKLHVDLYLLGRLILVLERHCPISITSNRR